MVEFDNDIRESQMIEMLTTEYTKILADGSDVKTQMTDFENPSSVQFCIILSSVIIVKKVTKKIAIF